MADRTAARRYAAAFLELAAELDIVTRLGRDLDQALAASRENDAILLKVLGNPVFNSDERKAVLDAVLPALDLHPMTSNLLRLLVDKGRFSVLPDLVEIFHEQADALAGRVRVEVTTAEALSDAMAKEIRDALARSTGMDVVLDTKVDASLIGGLVARVGGKVYDASMRARLEDLKHRLIHGLPPAQA